MAADTPTTDDFSSTPATEQNLTLLHDKASSNKYHINHIHLSLSLHLKTAHKVTGHCWDVHAVNCTCKYHCPDKSLKWHWNQALFLLTYTKVSFLKMATRWQQTLTDGTHRPGMAGLDGSLAFYSDMQSQAHFSFSPKNVTAQSRHCFVPLPSATL